jgi:hypothetical protein
MLASTDRKIESFAYQINNLVGHQQFDLNVTIALHEFNDCRNNEPLSESCWGGEPYRTTQMASALGDIIFQCRDACKDLTRLFTVTTSRLRQSHATGRTDQEANTEPFFQYTHALSNSRRRLPQCAARSGKTTVIDDSEKERHVVLIAHLIVFGSGAG